VDSGRTNVEMTASVLRSATESMQALEQAETESSTPLVAENTANDGQSQAPSLSSDSEPQQGARRWPAPEPKETIYVGNLFFDVTAEDLKRQMEKYGTVLNARIIHDNRGLSKG
jgi:nucleolin